jgi:hypothetical protein
MSNNRRSATLPSTVLGGVLAGVYAVVGGLLALGGAVATSGGAPPMNATAGLNTGYTDPYTMATPYTTAPRGPVTTTPSTSGYQSV